MLASPGVQTWLGFCHTVSSHRHVVPLAGGRMPCVSGVPGEEKKKVENHDCNYREKSMENGKDEG